MTTRTTAQDFAYKVGRQARIEGLTIEDANVRYAYKMHWVRIDSPEKNALLDECERGWHAQDELMNPVSMYDD